MKRIILFVTGLLIGAGGVLGQEFPAEEVWSVETEGVTALGSIWREGDAIYSLIGGDNCLRLYRDDRLFWISDTLEGPVTNALAVDFGCGDGIELICSYNRPFQDMRYPIAWSEVVVRFSGEHFSERNESVEFGGGIQPWSPEYGAEQESYQIDFLGHYSENNPDSSHSLVKIRGQSSSSSHRYYSWDRTTYKGTFLALEHDRPDILALGKSTSGAIGFEQRYEGKSSLSIECYYGEHLISSFVLDSSYWGVNESREIECGRLLAVKLDGASYLVCRYHDGEGAGLLAVIDPRNRNVVRTIPFPQVDLIESYRLPLEDEDDDYLITVSVDGLLQVYDLTTWRIVYSEPDFVLNPIGISIGNFAGDEDNEMMVLTQSTLTCYNLGDLGMQNMRDIPYPTSLSLSAFPNPFNSSTTINYSLLSPGRYAIDVIDIQGRLVTRLSDGWKEAGSYREVLKGERLASGQYLIQMNGTDAAISTPITIIK